MKSFISIVIFFLSFISNAYSAQYFVSGVVPHNYEFGSQNPNGYYWCGHTALKSVGKYITNQDRTLTNIHNTFWYNSSGYRANNYCYTNDQWCAKLQDLYWAAKYSQNGGYGKDGTVLRSISGYSNFLQKVKDGVINNLPIIVPSKWYYDNAGHFWIITGYSDSYTGNDYDTIIYLRDVAIPSPTYLKYDKEVTIKDFYDNIGYSPIQFLYMSRN